ncbi:ABC transporter permease [Specibacter cremeus]|uniref:ABC transporter permease n=1 Tax=Specibacter cremeus TaxID=1629051 RepID=UPI001F0BEE17|nr:ABC transporter permease [Specibacter cremeus]
MKVQRGGMSRLFLRRSLFGLFTLWVVSLVVFLATQALPGDAAQAILGREATPERLAALRAQLHLGGSLPEQYLNWLGHLLSLNLGTSLAGGMPVSDAVAPMLLNSTVLMVCAAVIAIPLAIGIGTWSALKKDTVIDNVTGIATLVLASLPEFVVGVLLVLLLSTGLFHLFPAVFVQMPGAQVWNNPAQLVLPVLTLVVAVSPYIIRIMRATMLEVLDSQYVQQARLKGLPERTVILRHAIPNAIGPVAQVIALQLAWLIGGVVLVEYLFRFPGVGFELIDAVTNRDMPVVQALAIIIALFYVVVNLLADVVTLVANPKVRTAS